MISLISIEFYKLWKRQSFIILLVLLSFCNVAFLFYMQSLIATIPSTSYQKLDNVLENISNEERYTFLSDYQEKIEAFQLTQANAHSEHIVSEQSSNLLFCDTLEQELLFMQEIMNEMNQLNNYSIYIQQIQEKADALSSVSIFQKKR